MEIRRPLSILCILLETACSLPSGPPPDTDYLQRLGAIIGSHSNDGGSFSAILGKSLQEAEPGYQPPVQKLMVFGGPGHKTYLGCLNCADYTSDSLANSSGSFDAPYGVTIFNEYGDFGSTYSMYSACAPFATDPPVIVDQAGNFYGRLTLNAFAQQTKNQPTLDWLSRTVCAH